MQFWIGVITLSTYINNDTPMNLPRILAGPILRRCESSKIFIWLATSEQLSITVEVFTIDFDVSPPVISDSALSTETDLEQIKLGQKLWINLLKVEPSFSSTQISSRSQYHPRSFPTDQILAYKLTGVHEGNTLQFEDLLTLDDIIYTPFSLPTFIIQNENSSETTLRVLYGSCRKLHGKGHDAMLTASTKMLSTVDDSNSRFHTLFLGGDQIYADDVSYLLTEHLTSFSSELLGFRETLPGLTESMRKWGVRQETLNRMAGFTSSEGHNHLIEFGEFAAMYLTAWNGKVWPDRYESASEIWHRLSRLNAPNIPPLNQLENWYMEVKNSLDIAKRGSNAARKLMANISTYMIFDDHDVTDDWYLNVGWRLRLLDSALGKRVVSYALCAYWLFQGWGNNPDSFPSSFKTPIIEHLRRHLPNYNNTFDNTLLDYNEWSFSTPTRPRAIFVDTRTQRAISTSRQDFVDDTEVLRHRNVPRLLNPVARRQILDLAQGLRVNLTGSGRVLREPLILVIPTPVYGHEYVEKVQRLETFRTSVEETDYESFHANPRSFLDILQLLLYIHTSPIIILSGDVHYGFVVEAKLRSIDILQLTSSAFKNEVTRLEEVGLQSFDINSFPNQQRTWINNSTDTTHHHTIGEDGIRLLSGSSLTEESQLSSRFIIPGQRRSHVLTRSNIGRLKVEIRSNRVWVRNDFGIFTHNQFRSVGEKRWGPFIM